MSSTNDPLWLRVAMAFDSFPNSREGAAAVLRIIADEYPPESYKLDENPMFDYIFQTARLERQRIRQHLLAEAERAEAGE